MIRIHTMHLARTLSKTAAALFGLALATASHAAWDTIPQVELSASHDDNLRLLPDDLPLDSRRRLHDTRRALSSGLRRRAR